MSPGIRQLGTPARPCLRALTWLDTPICLASAFALVAAIVLAKAWVSEDAFITYRVIDNLVAGHGLRWNVDERVQVFTHPLWALLQVPLFRATGDPVLSGLLLSVLCTGGAIVLAWLSVIRDRARFIPLVAVPLALSHAFTDYSTSGLENPLSHLLIAAFACLSLRAGARVPWFWLTCVVSLTLVNRMDAGLIVVPCLAGLLLARRRDVAWRAVIAGALPVALWEGFSVVYFGFPFPNTAYAKLGTGIDPGPLAVQGALYLVDLVRRDAASAGVLVLGLAAAASDAVAARSEQLRVRDREAWQRALVGATLGLGLVIHTLYTVAIGGDFMLGRFFSGPVLLAAILAARGARRVGVGGAAAAAGLLAAAALASAVVRSSSDDLVWSGIADEREGYAQTNSLLRAGAPADSPLEHAWFVQGRDLRRAAAARRAPGVRFVVPRAGVGMLGYAAGPDVTIIDVLGLGDPLLARLPISRKEGWRIGHFIRALPEGYVHARATGDLGRMPPALRDYYRRLRLVVSGPVFDPARLCEVARFNLGRNAAILERYLAGTAANVRGRRGRAGSAPGSASGPGQQGGSR